MMSSQKNGSAKCEALKTHVSLCSGQIGILLFIHLPDVAGLLEYAGIAGRSSMVKSVYADLCFYFVHNK